MTTIPYSVDIAVNPGVVAAGGANVTLNGLLLSTSSRVPIGTIATFNSGTAVEQFFGAQSNEFSFAEHYFAGYDNSQQKPGALLVTQYPQNPVGAYLQGGNVSSLTITQLQAFSAP